MIVALIFALLAEAGPKGPALLVNVAGPKEPALHMTVIDEGDQSGVDEARQVVVRTPEEWAKLWRVHGMDRTRPTVDFAHAMVVGVFMGSRPTAGFKVAIVGAEEESGVVTVRYRESGPSRDMVTAQVLTSPYALVTVPKSTGEVRFEKVD